MALKYGSSTVVSVNPSITVLSVYLMMWVFSLSAHTSLV